jgi:hypothetical protein
MSEKYTDIKKDMTQKNKCDINLLVEKKLDFFKDVIQKTIIHIQKNKNFDILGINDVNTCIEKLTEINKKIIEISKGFKNNKDMIDKVENTVNSLQLINNDLSGLFKSYGTFSLEDFLLICLGNNIKSITDEENTEKFELLKKYFHPTSYKILNKKEESKSKKNDVNHEENPNNLSCYDVTNTYKQFHMKVYGLKLHINSEVQKKTLIIFGVIDDVMIELMNSNFISKKNRDIKDNLPDEQIFKEDNFTTFISSLTLKDYFINNTPQEIYNKYVGINNQINNLKQKHISQIVKEFILNDMYDKRNNIMSLLILNNNYDNQYLAYLLYDLLSNDSNGTIDTQEQTMLFDSFPWYIKQCFKNAMKKTVQYTNELSNFDINKIPLEQQICLMKSPDTVKEKAMAKLKEIKSKTEDSGSKSRQYLDSLLKIPFGVYKREPILNVMNLTRLSFKDLFKKYELDKLYPDIPNKEKYTSVEICKYLKKIDESMDSSINIQTKLDKLKNVLTTGDKSNLRNNITKINDIFKKHGKPEYKLKSSGLNKEQLKDEIIKLFDLCNENNMITSILLDYFCLLATTNVPVSLNLNIKTDILNLKNNLKEVNEYMKDVKTTLDRCVYGHDKAKKQVEHVIAQWLNSDGKQSESHVLGFEGNPGVGKTTLAKGLSECLKDENGNTRPYSLIALGGDSNASTLCGHNFTYVGSNYGSIVQILIDKKCMNPIIVFDEVDKISRTEQGREITGILTHLLDPTQNNAFQDKYFSGIDIDLSKILFILSYNDVNAIDKVLLDRVNRIKFDSLTIEDKVMICNKHLLPDLYNKIGLEDMIYFSDEVLKFIIEEYTLEPGVRKLKELLFYIVGEINLNIFKELNSDIEIPIQITIHDIKTKYFKDKREVIIKKVPEESLVGYANGMFATSLGTGGTLPLHAKIFPSKYFLELKLTGLQQDVMKESMHVALTVAWNLTSDTRKTELRRLYDGENNKYGINIHTGDGAVSKDGPSAGSCITSVLYSLLNDIPIKAKFGITGEIQMSGEVTAIGGLNHKILGSIKAGVNSFIYPKENNKDFNEFYEKYKNDERLKNINFYEVSNIKEVLELLLEKSN